MAAPQRDILKAILQRGALPSHSPLALKLVDMAADETVSATQLAEVIEQDPGFTARLLHLVNSPVYRPGHHEITSVSRAVVILGLRELRIMALSLSLMDTLPLTAGGPDFHLFWRTSLHRAVLARLLAAHLKMPEQDEAFVAGLLQELGLPILLNVLSPEEARDFPGFHYSLEDQLAWARQSLGTDHRAVGRTALAHWKLPRALVESQLTVPDDARPGSFARVTLVADLARRGAESFFAPGVELSDIHEVARLRFDLSDETVNSLLVQSLIDVGELSEAMDIPLDPQETLVAVLEKAHAGLQGFRAKLAAHLPAEGDPPADPDTLRSDEVIKDTVESVIRVGGLARRLAQDFQGSGAPTPADRKVLAEAEAVDRELAEINRLMQLMLPRR
ncbi:MAG: HDOD domain-containing protein [Deltaproteobacteria bacterium]|nr:HDOD domain-containing protein [Deltaproteobacteria bacterium]